MDGLEYVLMARGPWMVGWDRDCCEDFSVKSGNGKMKKKKKMCWGGIFFYLVSYL